MVNINLYVAVDSEAHEAYIFMDYEELKEFAKEGEYAYDYYRLGEAEELSDYELGYWRMA